MEPSDVRGSCDAEPNVWIASATRFAVRELRDFLPINQALVSFLLQLHDPESHRLASPFSVNRQPQAMDIMDPFTSELLSAPPLPGAFSGCGAESDDEYLRAIGALPRRPCAPTSVHHPATLEPSSEFLGAALGAHVIQPAVVEVSVPPTHPAVKRKRAAPASDVAASKNSAKSPRTTGPWQPPDYDADIDFNLRQKERNAKQQPSPDYLQTVQEHRMDERTRASLVVWMGEFVRHFHLAPGTLHRAVSYVERVLSTRALSGGDYELRLLGAAAVFTAAKYEERSTILRLNAAGVAGYCGFPTTSKEVTDTERRMLATLRYELGGPTACTFVDHFTRNSRGERNYILLPPTQIS
uniref:Uncharacterized protein n=1 Tax=Avena sativa TaxID=4498 RepID=A0ACD6ALJ9_AVESA